MTPLLIAVVASLMGAGAVEYDHTHAALNAVLARHVHDGLVDYSAVKADRAGLDAYLTEAGRVPMSTFQGWSKDDQLAFLINVYNATTIQLIIDAYPVDSIKSLGSFLKSPWARESVQLFGKAISLDTLEHKIIRKNYSEPRIHFALVCAAMGCPPLRAEAYQGARLEVQLDDQARTFLATTAKNRIDTERKKLLLSPIFDWYRDDFEAASKSLAGFVAPYLGATEEVLASYGVDFTDYDWSLNDRAAGKP
jgi:hypothetical protein